MVHDDKVDVKKSKISGKGIYANRDIKKDEIIYIVKGFTHEFDPEDDEWSLPHSVSFTQNKWINPHPYNPLRYTNHSCNPNAIIGEGLRVIALKKIKKGEEVTIDYSLTENEHEKIELCRCKCGNKNCRKNIYSIHFLPEDMIKKNKKYLRKWIVDSYYHRKEFLKNNK
ncbi:MAG TPA: SET domain-containing protein [Alphaproteobacteria bacterium]|nr:SET domain-containing protein [Alphaproteobacteria bacterium]